MRYDRYLHLLGLVNEEHTGLLTFEAGEEELLELIHSGLGVLANTFFTERFQDLLDQLEREGQCSAVSMTAILKRASARMRLVRRRKMVVLPVPWSPTMRPAPENDQLLTEEGRFRQSAHVSAE